MNLIERVWNASPASVSGGLQRRWRHRGDKPGWHPIRSGPLAGVELYLASAQSGIGSQLLAGDYDSFFEDEALQGADMKGKIFWDIGAHIGYHSLWMAHRGASAFAFEPNPHNTACLQKNLERNDRLGKAVRLQQLALGNVDGEMTFRFSPQLRGESAGGHLTTARPPLGETVYKQFETATVPAARIDTLIAQDRIPPADLVKIDVEGAEALVLEGGQKFFSSRLPTILMEVHHIVLMMEVQHRLLKWGYKLRLLDEKNAAPSRCFIMAEPANHGS